MRYFDCIHTNSTFSNIPEEYFYWDGISNHFGNRRYRVLDSSPQVAEVVLDRGQRLTLFQKFILTSLKVASCFTGVVPLVMLCMKAICRFRFPEFQEKVGSPKPNTPSKKIDPESPIGKLIASYPIDKRVEKTKNYTFHLMLLSGDFNLQNNGSNRIHPDEGSTRLVYDFAKDSDVLFVADPDPASRSFGNKTALNIGDDKTIPYLKSILKQGFSVGKKVIVARIGTNNHEMTLAFDSSGNIKFIDSMGGSSRYETFTKKLTDSLNAEKICDSSKRVISFNGEVVATRLQNGGGGDCTRYSSLYAYQIMKERDLGAYMKVNGAFREGILKKFSDVKKISQAKPIKDARNVQYLSNVRPFMRSWLTHIRIGTEDIKEISLEKQSSPAILAISSKGAFRCAWFPHSRMWESIYTTLTYHEDGQKKFVKDLPHTSVKKKKFKDLIPKVEKTTYLFFSTCHEQPQILTLDENQSLVRQLNGKSVKYFEVREGDL